MDSLSKLKLGVTFNNYHHQMKSSPSMKKRLSNGSIPSPQSPQLIQYQPNPYEQVPSPHFFGRRSVSHNPHRVRISNPTEQFFTKTNERKTKQISYLLLENDQLKKQVSDLKLQNQQLEKSLGNVKSQINLLDDSRQNKQDHNSISQFWQNNVVNQSVSKMNTSQQQYWNNRIKQVKNGHNQQNLHQKLQLNKQAFYNPINSKKIKNLKRKAFVNFSPGKNIQNEIQNRSHRNYQSLSNIISSKSEIQYVNNKKIDEGLQYIKLQNQNGILRKKIVELEMLLDREKQQNRKNKSELRIQLEKQTRLFHNYIKAIENKINQLNWQYINQEKKKAYYEEFIRDLLQTIHDTDYKIQQILHLRQQNIQLNNSNLQLKAQNHHIKKFTHNKVDMIDHLWKVKQIEFENLQKQLGKIMEKNP